MDENFIPGQWYRLELEIGKVFLAEYQRDKDSEDGWFRFADGSMKQADTILPYLVSIIEIEPPDSGGGLDIYDFID